MLFELAKNLLQQVVSWPCSHLSLTVSGFESGITGNKSLDSFFIRGAGETPVSQRDGSMPNGNCQPELPDDNSGHQRKKQKVGEVHGQPPSKGVGFFSRYKTSAKQTLIEPCSENTGESLANLQTNPTSYYSTQDVCSRCGEAVPEFMQSEHDDWHLAKDLESQEQQSLNAARAGSTSTGKTRQTRLAFG